ncbi:MAG: hypothetical protein ACI4II_02325 [Acutalibacteraceae bacterium]
MSIDEAIDKFILILGVKPVVNSDPDTDYQELDFTGSHEPPAS